MFIHFLLICCDLKELVFIYAKKTKFLKMSRNSSKNVPDRSIPGINGKISLNCKNRNVASALF